MRSRYLTLLTGLIVLVGTIYFLRLSRPWLLSETVGPNDWDAQLFYLDAAVSAIRDYGEIPFWNPFESLPVLENPQTKFGSPTLLLALIFGTIKGMKLAMVFYYIVGVLGSVFLFRQVMRVGILPSIYGSFLFLLAGWVPLHLYAGHTTFISALCLPLVIGFVVRSIQRRGRRGMLHAAAAGMTLAVMYSEGHIIPLFVMPPLGVGLLAAWLTLPKRRRLIASRGLGVFAAFLLLGSYRIVPEVHLMMTTGAANFPDKSAYSLNQVWIMLTEGPGDPGHIRWIGAHSWWEYGSYVGVAPLLISLPLLAFARKQDAALIIASLLAVSLIMGRFWEYAPMVLLSKIPPYDHVRCYGRWAIIFLASWSALQAIWMHRFLTYAKHSEAFRSIQKRRIVYAGTLSLACLLCAFVQYDLTKTSGKIFGKMFHLTLPVLEKRESFTTITSLPGYGSSSSLLPALRANLALRSGYEILINDAPIQAQGSPAYKGEFYLRESAVQVKPVAWKPSSISFALESAKDDLLVVNQGWHTGWQVTGGFQVQSCAGLVCIPVKRGYNEFRIYFRKSYIMILIAVSFAGQLGLVAAMLVCLTRIRRSRFAALLPARPAR